MRLLYPFSLSLNGWADLSDYEQSGKVEDRHLWVRLPHTWGDSSVSRPLESDHQSRLEQNLFVTFSVAPLQMKLSSVPTSVPTSKKRRVGIGASRRVFTWRSLVIDDKVWILQSLGLRREGQKT